MTAFFIAVVYLCGSAPAAANASPNMVIENDGRYLELALAKEFDASQREQIQLWADFLSQSLLQVYGRWPREHWRMTVAPASASADDPIPWAQVIRGDINTIEFFISGQSDFERLRTAWTGYHEVAHLLIPYRGWGDLWFSEGLATYYQNVLQARMGLLSEQQMWQKIYNGLQRGVNDTAHKTLPLSDVSNALHTKGGFMRTYWSGARYFLEMDVRIRRQSEGRLSLDTALQRLNACCADDTLSVPQIVSLLDKLNELTLFKSLYLKTRESLTVTPVDALFASLGISVKDGKVVLQPAGPGADLRGQIAKKHTAPCSHQAGILVD
ncbi:MAG: hypothetical protein AB8C02_06615 [Halioglobus sp.]